MDCPRGDLDTGTLAQSILIPTSHVSSELSLWRGVRAQARPLIDMLKVTGRAPAQEQDNADRLQGPATTKKSGPAERGRPVCVM